MEIFLSGVTSTLSGYLLSTVTFATEKRQMLTSFSASASNVKS